MKNQKPNIVFICSGNSFRSQIAEGWGRTLKGDQYNFYSAGINPHAINPNAIKVMAEVGVDISQHQPKNLSDLGVAPDVIFTVCSKAYEACPVLDAGTKLIHVDITAPSALARQANSEAEALDCYRRVRDEIRSFVAEIGCYL